MPAALAVLAAVVLYVTLPARLGRGAGKGLQLLEGLDHRPIVSVPVACELTGLTIANANSLVTQFPDLRLLGEITGRKRDHRFAYHPYLDLLAERETHDEPPAVTDTPPPRDDVCAAAVAAGAPR